MTKKILNGVISVSLIVMLLCVGLVMGVMYDYLGQKIDQQLRSEAILVEEAWEFGGQEYLDALEKRTDIENRVTLIAPDGKVLYDSVADSQTMENHMEREEVKEALAEGEGKAVRSSFTLEKDTRYYARKTADGNIIRLSTSHYSQLSLLLDTFGMVLIIIVLLLIISYAISYRAAKAIIKPINDIDLDNPDINENYEELGPLLHRIHQQNFRIKKQMENLRKSREEFNIITENMNEGLVVIDTAMEILTYNKSAVLMLGGTNEEKVEGSVLKINRSEPFRFAVSEALSGRNAQVHLTVNDATYEVISNPVKDAVKDPVKDDGKITGAILIILDVTEREKGEKLRREFTSNVSHELKTPLTSIYGISDMLASGMVKAEDTAGFANTIKEESARLISLIDHIIKLSRLDENTEPQEKEPVDVNVLVDDVVDRLSKSASENDVKVSVQGEVPEVETVGYILDEIVYNVCENAIKYNKPGGFVDVTLEDKGAEWSLTVKDSGIGIPAGDRDRVFERFYRVDKSHSKQIGGTGLGLSIVKHAVAFLGGKIQLESEEGKGTTITINFPK